MADNSTGLAVKSIPTETVRGKIVDSAGTNEAAVSAAGRLSVDASGAAIQIAAGAANIGDVDVLSVVPGVTATSLGKAEDAGHTTGDTGVMVLAVRNDAGTVLSDTTLDYTPLSTDNTGALRVTGGSAGAQYVGDALATATPTGTMAIGLANAAAPTDVSANNDAVAQWMLRNGSAVVNLASGGTLVSFGQAVMASSLPVTLASNQSALTVTGTFWQATQPVSAAALPLPTGAATETTLSAASAKLPASVGSKISAASLSIVLASDHATVPVSGTFWQATQPVSAVSLPLPTGAAAETTLSAASAKLPATLGQKAMAASMAVVMASDQTAVASNITQIGGAAQSQTNPLSIRQTNGTTFLANLGETAATGNFIRLTDATNTAAIIGTINALKTDFSSIAGAVPSAANPVPVRLTDGAAFYGAGSSAPTLPVYSTKTSSALGAGASVDLTHYVASGKTGHLMGIDIASTVALKVIINTEVTAAKTSRVVLFTPAGIPIQWRTPYKTFITQASGDATSGFSVTITNKDGTVAADVYSTGYWDAV